MAGSIVVDILKETTNLVDSLGVKDLIQLGTKLTQQSIDAGVKVYAKKTEEKDSLIEIPEIYTSDYRLKLDDAKRWLEEDGLKVEGVVVQPDIAFKDCSDFEVIATNYKLGKKVKSGTRIILKYVTSEVIETSKKLFEDSEKKKLEAEREKAEKRKELAEATKQKSKEVITNIQHGFGGFVTNRKKDVGGIISNLTKKEKPNDVDETGGNNNS